MNINDLLTSDYTTDEGFTPIMPPEETPVDILCDSIELFFSKVKNHKTISEDEYDTWTEGLDMLNVVTFGEIPECVSKLIPIINEKEVSDGSSS